MHYFINIINDKWEEIVKKKKKNLTLRGREILSALALY